MDFKQAMCEYGIAPETIIDTIKEMKLSEIMNALPTGTTKSNVMHYLLSEAIVDCGDITYGEYLERVEDENKTKNC